MGKHLFNEDWRFRRLGEEAWTVVTLPHDAMLLEPRTADSAGGTNTGWFEGRDYVYEKSFPVPDGWKMFETVFEFEGVYQHAEVYINGRLAGKRPYGYIGFYVSADEYLDYGAENTLRVVARNADQPNSRWYSGAGIYRSVWLHQLPKEHVEVDGIRITTRDYKVPTIDVEVRTNHAGCVKVELYDGNEVMATAKAEAGKPERAGKSESQEEAGKRGVDRPETIGTKGNVTQTAEAKTAYRAVFEFVLPKARLWDADTPNLYACRVTFDEDVREETFGIRMIACDSQRGFCVNGRRVILKGACIHHDNGLLGAAAYPYAEERKVRLLKEAGFNAIRSAHNPCSKAFLEACDKLGMYVVDEYVDMWYIHKTQYDYASYFENWWKKDLLSLIERDYNHPSVVMYSIGNEVSETAQKKGIALCEEMTGFIHKYDARPVTCGINIFFNFLSSLGFGVYSDDKAKKEAERAEKEKGKATKKAVGSEFFNNMAGILGADFMKFGATLRGSDIKTREAFSKLDVAGYNYGINRYAKDLKKYPERVILGSETFGFDAARFWDMAKMHPAVIGDFVWAGMDYLGETGIGAMEYADYATDFGHGVGWISAGSGMLDLTGKTTSQMAYIQVAYEMSPIRIGVIPADHAFEKHSPSAWRMSNAHESWAWNGCEGKKTKVEVYARGAKVELLINGRSRGCKRLSKDCRASFTVTWEPGEVSAVVYGENGRELGRSTLSSAGEETRLALRPEKSSIAVDELCYVRLRYEDAKGIWKPLARGDIKVEVKGGTLLALGNACPYNARGYLGNVTDTYYGEAMAIIKPGSDEEITVHAESKYGETNVKIAVV